MCQLILKPAGVSIKPEILRHCNECNDDGIGVSFDDGIKPRLRMWKTGNPKHIDAALKLIATLHDVPAMIHFRRATSGFIGRYNAHPFYVDDAKTIAAGHNGVLPIRETRLPPAISKYITSEGRHDLTFMRELSRASIWETRSPSKEDRRSDTRLFVDHVLGNLDHSKLWWRDPDVIAFIRRLLLGDRMAILSKADGLVPLSSNFIEDGSILFSNAGYKPWTGLGAYSGHGRQHNHTPQTPASGGTPIGFCSSDAKVEKMPKELEAVLTGFVPLDATDFLVGYYYYRSENGRYLPEPYVQCVCCQKYTPSAECAIGLFDSDVPMLPADQKCKECKHKMTELAAIVSEFYTDDHAPNDAKSDELTSFVSDDPSDDFESPTTDDADDDAEVCGSVGALSVLELATDPKCEPEAARRLQTICDEITKRGGDPSDTTIFEVATDPQYAGVLDAVEAVA